MPNKPNYISNLPDLLKAVADGGELVMTHDGDAREIWRITAAKNRPERAVFTTIARAAKRKGYIVPTGVLYWNLSIAGQRALKRETTQ